MPTYDFIPFIPPFEQFELAHRAQHLHKNKANAPDEPVEFYDFANGEMITFKCRYENYTFPGELGPDTVALLHIVGPDTDFFYAPSLSTFFNRRQVINLI